MKLQRITLLAVTFALACAPGFAETPGNPPGENKRQAPATAQNPTPGSTETTPGNAEKDSARADAYYNYAMGHIYEQQYEASSNPDYATKARLLSRLARESSRRLAAPREAAKSSAPQVMPSSRGDAPA